MPDQERPAWIADEMTPAEIAEIEIGTEPLPPLKTAADLLREQEEIPPEPPLAAGSGGPQPPEGLRFDFAWERTVVPSDAGTRDREKIRDESGYVPLPLKPEAQAEWAKSIALWIGHVKEEKDGKKKRIDGRPGLQDYNYLLRKGHVGALEHLYPADPREERHRGWEEYASLLVRHGFTDKQVVKAADRRRPTTALIVEASGHKAVQRLADAEEKHIENKNEFAKAYLAAQKKKGAK